MGAHIALGMLQLVEALAEGGVSKGESLVLT